MPQDLLKFGMIPEFIGRVPIVVTLDPLSKDDLVRILTEPKNALTKQYEKLFELDGVKLEFDKKALGLIADMALERKTGARGLRAILEEIMLDVMYEIPSSDNIEKCIITEETVLKKAPPTLVYSDAQKAKKKIKKTESVS